jgi:predicted house-cleaning noncanonical NTP pyrophosphatase (MazG superfamily)
MKKKSDTGNTSTEYAGRKTWNKLVRDGVPEAILAKPGAKLETIRLRGKGLLIGALLKKAREEIDEIHKAHESGGGEKRKAALAEELADLAEVTRALAHHRGIEWREVKHARTRKLEKRGGFMKGIYLLWTEEPKTK